MHYSLAGCALHVPLASHTDMIKYGPELLIVVILEGHDFIRVGKGAEPERLYYEIAGEGKVVVFIHAGFLDRRMWEDQFGFFAGKGFRVLIYDVRGFGKSDQPKAEYSDSGDLKILLDELSIQKAVLVGISNGGRIALDFVVEHPDMVESLVLCNSGVSGYKSVGESEDELWIDVSSKYDKIDSLVSEGNFSEAVALNLDIWGAALSDEKRQRMLEIATDNYQSLKPSTGKVKYPDPPAFDRLSEIDLPVLIIVGEKDLRGSMFASERIHPMIKGSKLSVISNAGHIANMSRPDEFNRIVLGFISNAGSTDQ